MEYNSEQIGEVTVIRPPLDSHIAIHCDGYGFKEWVYKKKMIKYMDVESQYSSFPDGVENIASKLEMEHFNYSMAGFYTCKVEDADKDDMIFLITPGIAIKSSIVIILGSLRGRLKGLLQITLVIGTILHDILISI